jgi:hypothetical protein
MADSKITALTALTAADPVNDMFPVVDVSDTTMAASGTTKKISVNNILGASGTATLASATITGAATVGTTLGVTGVSTLASVGVTGAATVGTTLLVGTNTTLTNGNVIIGTSGKGIDFSATTSGSGTMTSELLNDYEEGTWVPTQGSGLTVVGAFSSSGTYTKVGRLVTINGVVIGATSVAVGATSVLCAGLPFSATNQATATAVNASFNASAFCAIDTVSFYAITSIVATTSIIFSATYVAA